MGVGTSGYPIWLKDDVHRFVPEIIHFHQRIHEGLPEAQKEWDQYIVTTTEQFQLSAAFAQECRDWKFDNASLDQLSTLMLCNRVKLYVYPYNCRCA